MSSNLSYLTAMSIGLLGGAHCVGMCGGIMGALTMAIPPARRTPWRVSSLLLSYNLGRILSYAMAGALVGSIGWWLSSQEIFIGKLLRWIAGLMIIAMGLYLGNWWKGLLRLERAGTHLWRHIQPLSRRLLPVQSAPQALLLGLLWGWLPCGLVYSALAWSASAASVADGAALMLCFGVGTLPAVLATGILAKQITNLQRSATVRSGAALLLIGYGVWTLPFWHSLMGTGSI